jgi:hypothetical protein
MICERAKRAALEFEDKVEYKEISTSDKNAFNEWVICDALFVDGKQIRTGPPPSCEKIKKIIMKRINKLKA